MPTLSDISTDQPAKPAWKRRRLGMSLRAMMVLIIVVGLIVGWHVNRARATRRAIKAVEAAGGSVLFNMYDDTDPSKPGVTRRLAWIPTWRIARLGDEYFYDVVAVDVDGKWDDHNDKILLAFPRLESFRDFRSVGPKRTSDATLEVLAKLPRLTDVMIQGERITEYGLGRLKSCRNLESLEIQMLDLPRSVLANLPSLSNLRRLDLRGCRIDDDAINAIGRMTQLEELHLSHPESDCRHRCVWALNSPRLRVLTLLDAELTRLEWKGLGGLSGLEEVDLSGTNVSDSDLVAFRNLKRLCGLALFDTEVTSEAKAELGKWLPGVTIFSYTTRSPVRPANP